MLRSVPCRLVIVSLLALLVGKIRGSFAEGCVEALCRAGKWHDLGLGVLSV